MLKSDYPLKVTVVMGTEATDNVQLFYTTFRGFNPHESITLPVKGYMKMQNLEFNLPSCRMNDLRIDPGMVSDSVIIMSIKIENGVQEKSFSGQEIPGHFELINLVAQNPDNGNWLLCGLSLPAEHCAALVLDCNWN